MDELGRCNQSMTRVIIIFVLEGGLVVPLKTENLTGQMDCHLIFDVCHMHGDAFNVCIGDALRTSHTPSSGKFPQDLVPNGYIMGNPYVIPPQVPGKA